MHILQISAVVCAFVSLLFLLIALGSDYWLIDLNLNQGLWKLCVYVNQIYVCSSIAMEGLPDYYHATRAFMLLGMIAGAIACIGLCCTFFSFQLGSTSMSKISAIASLAAAACVLIAMATFTGRTTSVSNFYGWSFGLGWASFPLFLITGGLAFFFDSSASVSA